MNECEDGELMRRLASIAGVGKPTRVARSARRHPG
jgi:hypothetical protein